MSGLAAGAGGAGLGTRKARVGRVEAFDAERGLGTVVEAGGEAFAFHSTAIVDGSRQIAVGTIVAFVTAPALGGRYEAASVQQVSRATGSQP